MPGPAEALATHVTSDLSLSVLDFVGIEYGESATASIKGAVGIAQAVEAAGYRRYWVSEHHNMRSLACSAPEILTAHIAAQTARIRVGAAGIMLPNHAAFKVAETFRTLVAMYPGRVDLALGRAPGTDPLTAHVLRRGLRVDPAEEFPDPGGGAGRVPRRRASRRTTRTPRSSRHRSSRRGRSCSCSGRAVRAEVRRRQRHERRVRPPHEPRARRRRPARYRRDFTPRHEGDEPYSAMSVIKFASDDDEALLEFEAAWTLTMANLRRGIREPLRPEQVTLYAQSAAFRDMPRDGNRMVTGSPKAVVERLLELKAQAQVDEIVAVTPSLDRARRTASLVALAEAWRAAS